MPGMGMLVEGQWHTAWYDTAATGGRFRREPSRFRDWVAQAAPGRYRLIVSYACPWAHRTLVVRALKRLEQAVATTVVQPVMGDQGWLMPDGTPLYEIYRQVRPDHTGRCTVPILWDDQAGTIVNNESADIIRMFNAWSDAGPDLYPEPLRPAIDELNAFVYERVNDGVYRAGFATTQDAYEEAFDALFAALDELDARLGRDRYLLGERLTEADWRLFTTLVRFDAVYFGHFKCNQRRIADYPNLWPYLRELYQMPGIAETVRFDHIKAHYYRSHKTINPNGIVPKGPRIDFLQPHGRDLIGTWESSGC